MSKRDRGNASEFAEAYSIITRARLLVRRFLDRDRAIQKRPDRMHVRSQVLGHLRNGEFTLARGKGKRQQDLMGRMSVNSGIRRFLKRK